MIFLDTGFFIAIVRRRDENHLRAIELNQQLKESWEANALSESVLGETTSYLRRHDGAEKACEEAEKILDNQQLTLLFPTQEEVRGAVKILRKHAFASYTDALNVSIMQCRGITKIVSFDSEFDKVPGIKRIF